MEAKETPEKIYIHVRANKELGTTWHGKKITNSDIEYVRKDAFIEKAENFLEMLGYGFAITDNITHTNYGKEQLIEDFRNYMKGKQV